VEKLNLQEDIHYPQFLWLLKFIWMEDWEPKFQKSGR